MDPLKLLLPRPTMTPSWVSSYLSDHTLQSHSLAPLLLPFPWVPIIWDPLLKLHALLLPSSLDGHIHPMVSTIIQTFLDLVGVHSLVLCIQMSLPT